MSGMWQSSTAESEWVG